MRTSLGRVIAAVAGCVFVAATGCGRSDPSSSNQRPGVTGTSFLVTLDRKPGGTVTSSDGRINCGTGGTACGPVSYAWSATVVLVATPDAGNMFGTWAGDCIGRQLVDGRYTCFLDTRTYGADKYVVAVFGEQGRTQHANWSNTTPDAQGGTLHGGAFLAWIAREPDTFECTYCHGATYNGTGTAPSCSKCHASKGHPDWLADCNFCHLAPPQNGLHPAVSSDTTTCWGCHQGTVDNQGVIIAGGNHMNGQIDATGGHADGYDDPQVHGRDFFGAISSNPTAPYCTGCHGTSYEVLIANGRSCNTCHAAPTSATPPGGGWSGTEWKSNCTFCHGEKTIAYAAPADLNRAAPPDAISQRLAGAAAPDRTGAHAIHLAGSPLAGPVLCSNCHLVPTALTHISGRDVRAEVVVQGPGAAGPEAGYQADGTCFTRCHGSSPSPTWTFSGIACNGCHEVPPSTSIHSGISGADRTVCALCHPDTVTSGGAIDVAGGRHVNGQVDSYQHPAGFGLPINHGPAYLDYVAGAPGAMDCRNCHGASLDYCSSCHSQPVNGGWVSWQTNCTFCHGTKTPTFVMATDLNSAAPPDAITQRLDGVEVPSRTGQHNLHLADGGFVPAPTFQCATCHDLTVPSHISVARRATVDIDRAMAFPNLSPGELARLPSPLGTYDGSVGTCTSYCHGATMQGGVNTVMNWTNDYGSPSYTPILDCTDCHGLPPPTGLNVVGHTYPLPAPTNTQYCASAGCANHEYHRRAQNAGGWDSCAACHYGSAQGSFYDGLHVSGKPEVVYVPSGTLGYKAFTATWDPVTRSCTSTCHTKSGATTVQFW